MDIMTQQVVRTDLPFVREITWGSVIFLTLAGITASVFDLDLAPTVIMFLVSSLSGSFFGAWENEDEPEADGDPWSGDEDFRHDEAFGDGS